MCTEKFSDPPFFLIPDYRIAQAAGQGNPQAGEGLFRGAHNKKSGIVYTAYFMTLGEKPIKLRPVLYALNPPKA